MKLIEAGQVGAYALLNPTTNRMQYWMDASHIVGFHARFVMPTTLHKETGLHRNSIYSLLDAARVERFAPNAQLFGAIFLRSDLANIPQFTASPHISGPKLGKNG